MVVLAGVTTKPDVGGPPDQVYDGAPDAVRVAELPAQTILRLVIALTLGPCTTCTGIPEFAAQFKVLVPITVKKVEVPGATVIVCVPKFPGDHE